MERTPVKSSQIVSIGHDPEKNELHIEFASGQVYRYFEVTADEHQALLAADSIGKHFGAHVRNVKKYEKVAAEKTQQEQEKPDEEIHAAN
jgi:hypothetical protein